ncbi:hypothetical protein R6Q57_026821 [Mikania cordata]
MLSYLDDILISSEFSFQDKRMCKTETVFSGVTVDYNTHRMYDKDCFSDILNILDFPMESLEVDGFAEDWASELGPIPSEVFKEVMPPSGPQIGSCNFGYYMDSPFDYPVVVSIFLYSRVGWKLFHIADLLSVWEFGVCSFCLSICLFCSQGYL